jgi:hypothetical protein
MLHNGNNLGLRPGSCDPAFQQQLTLKQQCRRSSKLLGQKLTACTPQDYATTIQVGNDAFPQGAQSGGYRSHIRDVL